MLSYGSIIDPESPDKRYRKEGIFDYSTNQYEELNSNLITEDICYSWYHDEHSEPRHPADGLTQPKYDPDSGKYTWAKAPRYGGAVIQTGPLAQLAVNQDPLILGMLSNKKCSAWTRQFARIHRQASSLKYLTSLLEDLLTNIDSPTMTHTPLTDGEGFGMIEAARGSLGHWMRVENGSITNYQVITPTAWNASPRDQDQIPGHIEQSLIGLDMPDQDDPIEVGHVVRSHDPCLVCTVHLLGSNKKHRFGAI